MIDRFRGIKAGREMSPLGVFLGVFGWGVGACNVVARVIFLRDVYIPVNKIEQVYIAGFSFFLKIISSSSHFSTPEIPCACAYATLCLSQFQIFLPPF